MGLVLSNLELNSPDIQRGKPIAAKHTYEGGNISPGLKWRRVPEGTRSIAVFCYDPDAPLVSSTGNHGFVHWLLYNIPPDVTGLKQGQEGYARGLNNFDEAGYGGPKPPKGHGLHHYFFWVMALDVEPAIQDGLTLADFLEKVEPHVLGLNRIVGTYEMT